MPLGYLISYVCAAVLVQVLLYLLPVPGTAGEAGTRYWYSTVERQKKTGTCTCTKKYTPVRRVTASKLSHLATGRVPGTRTYKLAQAFLLVGKIFFLMTLDATSGENGTCTRNTGVDFVILKL